MPLCFWVESTQGCRASRSTLLISFHALSVRTSRGLRSTVLIDWRLLSTAEVDEAALRISGKQLYSDLLSDTKPLLSSHNASIHWWPQDAREDPFRRNAGYDCIEHFTDSVLH